MTTAQIANAVDRGLQIRREIDVLKDELTTIETALKNAGRGKSSGPLADPDSEGYRFDAKGIGLIVPVIYTSDLLMKSFAADSKQHEAIKASLGQAPDRLLRFFSPKHIFETAVDDASGFRRRAREVLGAEAPAFLSACTQRKANGVPKNQERVDWDHAKPV